MRIRRHTSLALLTGCLFGLFAGCGKQAVTVDPQVDDASAGLAAHSQAAQQTKEATRGGEEERSSTKDAFHFPNDRGGKLLAELLPPSEKGHAPIEAAPKPRTWPTPASLERPELPLPPNAALPPHLPPAASRQPLRPAALPEGLPLADYRGDPLPPQAQHLFAGDRVRLASPDVNQPAPLPLLAQPAPDRAPLDDPTTDASLATALAAPPPERTNPAPFVRLTLPDPFENRQAIRLPPVPVDDPVPSPVALRPPR